MEDVVETNEGAGAADATLAVDDGRDAAPDSFIGVEFSDDPVQFDFAFFFVDWELVIPLLDVVVLDWLKIPIIW